MRSPGCSSSRSIERVAVGGAVAGDGGVAQLAGHRRLGEVAGALLQVGARRRPRRRSSRGRSWRCAAGRPGCPWRPPGRTARPEWCSWWWCPSVVSVGAVVDGGAGGGAWSWCSAAAPGTGARGRSGPARSGCRCPTAGRRRTRTSSDPVTMRMRPTRPTVQRQSCGGLGRSKYGTRCLLTTVDATAGPLTSGVAAGGRSPAERARAALERADDASR